MEFVLFDAVEDCAGEVDVGLFEHIESAFSSVNLLSEATTVLDNGGGVDGTHLEGFKVLFEGSVGAKVGG